MQTLQPFLHQAYPLIVIRSRKAPFLLLLLCGIALQVTGQSSPPPISWDKTLGGPVDDYLKATIVTPDGGYLLGGYSFQGSEGGGSEPFKGLYDYVVVKLDQDGNKTWEKAFGGDSYDFLTAFASAPNGGYLLGGYSLSGNNGDKSDESRGGYDYWIIKIDQDGNKEWDKTFGGSDYDLLYAVTATPDGGWIIGGTSSSGASGDRTEATRGTGDYWILKLDGNGNKQWDKSFGGSNFENFRCIINTPEGGYLLGGYSQSGPDGDKSEDTRGFYDYWIVKTDQDGNKIWDRTFGGGNLDELTSMITTTDNGYLLGGDSYSRTGGDKTEGLRGFNDYWMVKIDQDGNKQWDRTYGGTSSEYFASVTATADGGYLLGGTSGSGISGDKTAAGKGEFDFWIIKTDDGGNIQWDVAYGGNKSDNLTAVLINQEGGYVFSGQSNSGAGEDKSDPGLGGTDFWIVKLQAETNKEDQTITVELVPDQTYGDPDFSVSAAASSGLPVTLEVVSGPATITNDIITINGAGTVTIKATQDGNNAYNPAPEIRQHFTVNKATPLIIWNPASLTEQVPLGDEQLNATATFKDAQLDGTFVYVPAAGTWLTAGQQTLKAGFMPADVNNFNAITDFSVTVTVTPCLRPIVIKSFSPGFGCTGSFVVVSGDNLFKTALVSINGIPTAFSSLNYHQIRITIPDGAVTGLISITGTDGNMATSNKPIHILYTGTQVSYFTPASGPSGKKVLIAGTGFAKTTQVLFNETAAGYFRVLNNNLIEVQVPQGAVTGRITVTTPEMKGTSLSSFAVTDYGSPVTINNAAKPVPANEAGARAGIYPNPFTNLFTITIKGNLPGTVPAALYNLEGRLVLSIPAVRSGQQVYPGNQLAPGVYVLKVGTGKNSYSYTVIKSN